jgi:hypothetical protein
MEGNFYVKNHTYSPYDCDKEPKHSLMCLGLLGVGLWFSIRPP